MACLIDRLNSAGKLNNVIESVRNNIIAMLQTLVAKFIDFRVFSKRPLRQQKKIYKPICSY